MVRFDLICSDWWSAGAQCVRDLGGSIFTNIDAAHKINRQTLYRISRELLFEWLHSIRLAQRRRQIGGQTGEEKEERELPHTIRVPLKGAAASPPGKSEALSNFRMGSGLVCLEGSWFVVCIG